MFMQEDIVTIWRKPITKTVKKKKICLEMRVWKNWILVIIIERQKAPKSCSIQSNSFASECLESLTT